MGISTEMGTASSQMGGFGQIPNDYRGDGLDYSRAPPNVTS